VTTAVRPGRVDQALAALERLAAEDQAIVICALREAGEQAHDVAQVLASVQARFGSEVEVLHGALSDERKLAVMARFRQREVRILVATTVVEVGIDVPTLALVVVLDAERFGLAQLHQLRGRLGRGTRPGQCLLLHGPEADCDRLAILAATDDGLAIADADLATRGPGELLGSQQHGVLRLRVADLGRDLDLLQAAHQRVAQAGSADLPSALQAWVPGSDAPLAGAG
jgi:ATP-dependent DNA helicase RecG